MTVRAPMIELKAFPTKRIHQQIRGPHGPLESPERCNSQLLLPEPQPRIRPSAPVRRRIHSRRTPGHRQRRRILDGTLCAAFCVIIRVGTRSASVTHRTETPRGANQLRARLRGKPLLRRRSVRLCRQRKLLRAFPQCAGCAARKLSRPETWRKTRRLRGQSFAGQFLKQISRVAQQKVFGYGILQRKTPDGTVGERRIYRGTSPHAASDQLTVQRPAARIVFASSAFAPAVLSTSVSAGAAGGSLGKPGPRPHWGKESAQVGPRGRRT